MMINVTLSDGKILNLPINSTGLDVANTISSSLAKDALLVAVDGHLSDLNTKLSKDCSIQIITKKNKESLEVLRHDMAHILAQAVLRLFPEVQVTIGPVIEDGFYYDFYSKNTFSLEDLSAIEKEMANIIDENHPIERSIWSRDFAIDYFNKDNQPFKAEIIQDIPKDQALSMYKQGDFLDLCRGPHFSSTGKSTKHFKLTKVSAAYWRGDHTRENLQRIYGTAFFSKKELDAYLTFLEEAKARDHRKWGKALNLFHIQNESPGSIFWHPDGWTLYSIIESYMRKKQKLYNYSEVKTPQIISSSLWEKSGHWEKFKENMFMLEGDKEAEYGLKPMNCPGHVQIFNSDIRSYKDLPMRYCEFGCCMRNEPSGALHGLMRVRSFVQDDGHIFCTFDQVTEEALMFTKMLKEVYKDFFGDYEMYVKFSDRPEKRIGSDATWDRAEETLKLAADQAKLDWVINSGEGAFYGPKLEFVLKDAIGRHWQLGTLQLDFMLGDRLGANYISEEGNKEQVVILHRAILGSFERFIGILLEQHGGALPLWLSPIQVTLLSVTDKANDYAQKIFKIFNDHNVRAKLDLRSKNIQYKVRDHSVKKVPVIIVVGMRDAEENTVSVRFLGSNKVTTVSVDSMIEAIIDRCGNFDK